MIDMSCPFLSNYSDNMDFRNCLIDAFDGYGSLAPGDDRLTVLVFMGFQVEQQVPEFLALKCHRLRLLYVERIERDIC